MLPPVDANEAEGHGGSRDDSYSRCAPQRHFDATGHRFRSVPVTQAMLNRSCSGKRPSDDSHRHHQRSCLRPAGRARRPDNERFPARISGHDRHQVRLRRRAMPECAVIVDVPNDRAIPPRPASSRPRAWTANRSARSKAMRRTASSRPAEGLHRAFLVPVRLCTAGFLNEGQVLLERLARAPSPAPISRRPSAKRWTATVPLHRLRQISSGRARRDPGGSGALPSKRLIMRIGPRTALFVAAMALPTNMMAAYAVSGVPSDNLASVESFSSIGDPAARSAA